ncbi:hypothetical protein TYRP_007210 [Tyrophagus putrescentiae]|nr:hypothetical protein TYRP_007210 [Tyrophagus putrescentiae]
MFINLRGSSLNLTDWWRQAVVVVATVVHPHLKASFGRSNRGQLYACLHLQSLPNPDTVHQENENEKQVEYD